MKFPPAFLDEIRARLPVSEVVGQRVKLKKQGREWAGLSPFNAEKTPSFFVNDQKGFYHDFSSSKHGDAFDFLMETEGLSFPEAVERLAGMAGLPMPVHSQESQEQEKKRSSLHEVMVLAAQFFERTLQEKAGAKARGYLADRRLDANVQREFSLGYAPPDRFTLRDALAAKGVSAEDMIACGLLVHGEDIAVPYDRFRDRVMFPIHDRSGRVIAFGGRAMDSSVKPKYLNSPETGLFHKSSVLFNHHRARKAAHDTGEAIVVEGYVDVIAMSQVGYPNTVAPLGTALTSEQCELLWRMAAEPILCFDGDKAGQKAAFRAIDMALPLIGPGKTLRFARLPEGQDPDDLARSEGEAAIAQVIAAAKPLAEMLFLRETEGQRFDTPERRAALERRLRELTRTIADETLRRHYQEDMEARLSTFLGSGKPAAAPRKWEPRGGGGRSGWRPNFANQGPRLGLAGQPLPKRQGLMGRPKDAPRDIVILAIVINHPDLMERHIEEIAALDLSNRTLAAFRDQFLALALESPARVEALEAALMEERDRILRLASQMPVWWCLRPEADSSDADQVLRQTLALHRKARALNKELKLAEKALATDANPEINEQSFGRLRDIKENLADLANAEAAIEGFGALSGRKAPPV
ncbi:DNA primase [Methylocapsa sp. S129]|uniref:DNA primase n=1 Tax=Methylocapsa sp. S129 TaxID=1641869 RepID=UPI00131A612B|nr:DNA primase [Methylocapsa sp. S129]